MIYTELLAEYSFYTPIAYNKKDYIQNTKKQFEDFLSFLSAHPILKKRYNKISDTVVEILPHTFKYTGKTTIYFDSESGSIKAKLTLFTFNNIEKSFDVELVPGYTITKVKVKIDYVEVKCYCEYRTTLESDYNIYYCGKRILNNDGVPYTITVETPCGGPPNLPIIVNVNNKDLSSLEYIIDLPNFKKLYTTLYFTDKFISIVRNIKFSFDEDLDIHIYLSEDRKKFGHIKDKIKFDFEIYQLIYHGKIYVLPDNTTAKLLTDIVAYNTDKIKVDNATSLFKNKYLLIADNKKFSKIYIKDVIEQTDGTYKLLISRPNENYKKNETFIGFNPINEIIAIKTDQSYKSHLEEIVNSLQREYHIKTNYKTPHKSYPFDLTLKLSLVFEEDNLSLNDFYSSTDNLINIENKGYISLSKMDTDIYAYYPCEIKLYDFSDIDKNAKVLFKNGSFKILVLPIYVISHRDSEKTIEGILYNICSSITNEFRNCTFIIKDINEGSKYLATGNGIINNKLITLVKNKV